jgi:uncharacterized protein (TIGR02147 family)
MCLKTFKNDPKWIATVLSKSLNEVNISIERLKQTGMIEVLDNGQWVDLTSKYSNFGNTQYTNHALKKMQKKVLEMSIKSIDEVDIKKRSHTGTVMAVDTKNLEQAKKLIHKFRREMGQLLTSGVENEVYQLQISLFPLSNVKKQESHK